MQQRFDPRCCPRCISLRCPSRAPILRCCACSREVTSALLTAVHNLLERLTPSRPLPALAACVLLDMPLLDEPEHSGCAAARIKDQG